MRFHNVRNPFRNDVPFAPLYINSCGISREISISKGAKSVCRPEGRSDYQLIYITKGKMLFHFKGEIEQWLDQGTLVVYKPTEPQIYSYPPREECDFFWIHFGGDCAESMLKECGLYEKNSYYLPDQGASVHIVENMLSELTKSHASYQIRLMGYFCQMLSMFSQGLSYVMHDSLSEKLSPALKDIENHPETPKDVGEYAQMCHMSKYHFIREFKRLTGQSPIQYRNALCMNRAAELLENTNLSVSEIAASMGIDNPLYFSKKFKDFYGISPSSYRTTVSDKK